MNEPTKQTVYLPVKVEDELPEIGEATFTFNEEIDTCSFLAKDGSFKEWYQHFEHKPTHWLKPQELFVFTKEQLNKYTQSVIKQALETAAEKVEIHSDNYHHLSKDFEYAIENGKIWVPSNSITNTFEETYQKLKV